MGLSAEWWSQPGPVANAGRDLYSLLVYDKPVTRAQLINTVSAFWAAVIKGGVYASRPAAHLAQTLFENALTTLLVPNAQLPYLTTILGADAVLAHSLMPSTDFGVAGPAGGTVRKAASLEVPAGCLAAPSLVSVTTFDTTPEVVADDIGAAWAPPCTPTVGLKSAEPDDLTALTYLNAAGDREDYDAAITSSDGWIYTKVPHLSPHDDAEPSISETFKHVVRKFVGGGAADVPTCLGVRTDLVSGTEFGWRSCFGYTDQRDVYVAAAWDRLTARPCVTGTATR